MCAAFSAAEAAAGEGYAVAQCGIAVDGSKKGWTYFVRSLHVPEPGDILEQSSITVTPRAEFMEAVLSDAARRNNAVMEIHTHVGSREPNFSWVDIENGLENGRFLRECGLRFAMAVVGRDGFSLCEYDPDHDALQMPGSARISVMGREGVKDAMIHGSSASCELPQIEHLRVFIAGMDGVGFGIAAMLAGMGVKNFVLFDDGVVDDTVPETLPYETGKGKRKTKAALNMLKKISTDLEVIQTGDVGGLKAAFKGSDVIFICGTDEETRAALNEISLKYFIPCIEARTAIKSDGTGPYGYVHIYMPSATGCAGCFTGAPVKPAAAADTSTIAVNGVVSSIAVREFLGAVCGREPGNRAYDLVEYDPSTGAMIQKLVGRRESCALCCPWGILGAGDERKPAKASRLKKAKNA
jgi:molybdopterin-synthase adenylyltransferase